MNKIIIPSIFVATVLVAGMFALMPVEKVSAVHTTLLSTLCKALFNLTTCPTTQTTVLSTGGTLGADSITAATIATGAIGADEIAAGAITASEAPNLDAAVSSRATPTDVTTAADGQNRVGYWQIRAGAATVVNLIPAGETITGRLVVSTLAAAVGGTCELRAAGGANDSIAGVSNIAVDTTGAATVTGQSGLDVAVEVALSTCSVGVFFDSTSG